MVAGLDGRGFGWSRVWMVAGLDGRGFGWLISQCRCHYYSSSVYSPLLRGYAECRYCFAVAVLAVA